MPRWAREFAYGDPAGTVLNAAGILLGGDCAALPRGEIVAVARLSAVARTEDILGWSQVAGLLEHEIDFGDLRAGAVRVRAAGCHRD